MVYGNSRIQARRMAICCLSVSVVLTVVAGPVPTASGAVPAPARGALAKPRAGGDVPMVPSQPLGHIRNRRDPAGAIDPLSDSLSELPEPRDSSVVLGSDWAKVPGLPIKVRPAEVPAEAPSPGSSPSASSDMPGDGGATNSDDSTSTPSVGPSEAPATAPSEPVLPTPSGNTADDQPPSVVVSVHAPPENTIGRILLTFARGADPALPESGVTPSANPEGGSETPSSSPSATADEPVEPSEPPSLDPSPEAATPSGLASDDPGVDPRLDVRVSYGQFANAFGGAWFDRLDVVAYPSCFATTPELAECATGVPIALTNHPRARRLTFTTVDEETIEAGQHLPETTGVPPSGQGGVGPSGAGSPSVADPVTGGVVYAVGGTDGSYGANPLATSSSWQSGIGSGEFSFSYPFALPQALGGSTPDLALEYSSGSVDGKSLAENGQSSMAGIGWDLSTSYITRQYAACADEGFPEKGDLCWNTVDGDLVDDLSIVLNGHASRLVRINDTNEFRLTADPGWKVEKLQTDHPTNPDNNNEAFRVMTPDGTKYWFGFGNGSGSVLTVPVFATEAAHQCYDATASQSWCQQGWQWYLDKVIDPHGNVIRYTYADETNNYALWGNTTQPVMYDRAGRLTKIEYGYRNDDTVAHQIVQVASGKRCTKSLTNPQNTCTGADSPQNNPSLWPDVPTDLICDSASNCLVGSPSFFTIYRYAQVTTETVQGTSDPTTRKVDEYTLTHTMPDPDDSGPDQPDLWLSQVDRTGYGPDGETQPMTPFSIYSGGSPLQNRVVATGNDRTLKKYRVGAIRNEQGGRIDIEYGHAQSGVRTCDPGYVDGLDRWTSTRECFPQKYAPPGGSPHWEWFHKYVVTRIALSDIALGYKYLDSDSKATDLGQLRIYDYEYRGIPAWRWVRDNNVADADETWDDWRGYETTLVHTRDTPSNDYGGSSTTDLSVMKTTVFRGMNHSRKNPDGDVNNGVKLDTEEWPLAEDEPLDEPWLQGRVAESKLVTPSGAMINRTYREYRDYETASDDMGPDGHIVWEHVTRSRTKDTTGGLDLVRETTTETDPGGEFHLGIYTGTVISTSTIGYRDAGEPGHQSETMDATSCTTTTWDGNSTGENWLRAPKTTTTYNVDCPRQSSGTILAKTDACYDLSDVAVAGCPGTIETGELTGVRTYTSAGQAPITTKTVYDSFGRVKSQTNGRGNTTTYTYNGAGSSAPDDLLTSLVVTQPPVQVNNVDTTFTTTTQLDQRRGQPTSVTDPNGQSTTLVYDPLGRLTDVTYPGNTPGHPSIKYRYTLANDKPSRVWTQTLRKLDNGAIYDSSYTFSDGWGRTVETQVPTLKDQPDNPRATHRRGHRLRRARPGPVHRPGVGQPQHRNAPVRHRGQPRHLRGRRTPLHPNDLRRCRTTDPDPGEVRPVGGRDHELHLHRCEHDRRPARPVRRPTRHPRQLGPRHDDRGL